MKTIFGFGSLIYTPSLLATAPNATGIRPAYIKGFVRSFNFWDAVGYTETNLDVAGQPMCALDVAKADDPAAKVNGVTFNVSDADLKRLLIRETGMELIKVTAYDYKTDEIITDNCHVFYGNKNDGKYLFGGAAQQRYLNDYLKAAKLYGEGFYQEVLATTFINGQRLTEVEGLNYLGVELK